MLYSEDIFSLSINSPIPLSLPQATKIKPNKIKKMLLFFSYQSHYIFFVFKKYNIFFKKGKEKRTVAN